MLGTLIILIVLITHGLSEVCRLTGAECLLDRRALLIGASIGSLLCFFSRRRLFKSKITRALYLHESTLILI